MSLWSKIGLVLMIACAADQLSNEQRKNKWTILGRACFFVLACLMFLCGCATTPPQPERATNEIGQVFELVQPAITNAAYTDIELWERVNPSDTNRFYTPTLEWQLHPTNPPSFKAILK